ncbi:MAG: PH domain-containing protein [Actinobacteria bacterium]|nr:PH domain-containing protein [Actinomycetota bacterium]
MLAERDERVYLMARCHGIVLVRPLVRSALLLVLGGGLFTLPGVVTAIVGAVLTAAAALLMLRAVWAWERTRLVVTTEKIYVVNGMLHRRAKAVRLRAVEAVEVDQSLLGQMLGYGTVVVGPLSIGHIAEPKQVCRLVERLAS